MDHPEVNPYLAPDENHPYLEGVTPWLDNNKARSKPRFVQLHGASGSGKTTLVRELMKRWGPVMDVHLLNYQRQPIVQFLMNAPNRPLCLVGHYYAACGGADTLKSRHVPYLIAKEALDLGYDVLLEGIFLSVELHRVVALQEAGYDRHNVFIDVPIAWCEESVQLRREAAGKDRRALKQMDAFHPRIMHTYDRMSKAGLSSLFVADGGSLDEDADHSPRGDAMRARYSALAEVEALLA